MYKFLRSLLFLLPAENAHKFTLNLFRTALKIPGVSNWIKSTYQFDQQTLQRDLWQLKFSNPVGLAAGFDKDGKYIEAMSALGFGFIELGTVTPRPQRGNPKPRLFRLPKDKALINRMGFNNEGVDVLVKRLKKLKNRTIVIGGNIGKNKDTPNEDAIEDYIICFEKLYPYIDYLAINVSSPNTPGLRELQEEKPLRELLEKLQTLNSEKPERRPLFLKIAPDLSISQLDRIVEISLEVKLDGLIATNTTINREGLKANRDRLEEIGPGGLSGYPLRQHSTYFIKRIRDKSGGKLPVIAVGGISSGVDAMEKFKAGASLIQVYTGMIYEGPDLIKRIKVHLAKDKV